MKRYPRLTFLPMLLLCSAMVQGASVRTVSVRSDTMRKKVRTTIILPDSYRTSRNSYSVVYLLHGYSRNHSTWMRMAPLTTFADRYQLILVCPDAGYASWYVDSPLKKGSQYETFIARELPAFIDATLRTHAHAQGRALIGSSMGGHGAVTILAKHPAVFQGAGSISGIMDLTEFYDKWEIDRVLGPYDGNKQLWKEASFINLIPPLSHTQRFIFLDCGSEDFALSGNRRAHQELTRHNIPHLYVEEPGSHTPEYVRKRAEDHFRKVSELLLPPAPASKPHR